jgi:hypothetical protein
VCKSCIGRWRKRSVMRLQAGTPCPFCRSAVLFSSGHVSGQASKASVVGDGHHRAAVSSLNATSAGPTSPTSTLDAPAPFPLVKTRSKRLKRLKQEWLAQYGHLS